MSKKGDQSKNKIHYEVDPTECPFREFRDNELSPEFWGLGPSAFRAVSHADKTKTDKVTKTDKADYVWIDEQTQPLPRSVRQYLHGWIRAEELAMTRWEAEVVIFEENNGGKMSVMDMQLSHAQVLLRSSFCRRVLSACYILERVEGFSVEHQWENFMFSTPPEGWRARYHIYSPGLKPGGGQQHRPGLSKNGCYLVRLFYLGAWRCVWVSDQVPVDATDSPLLPFSPLLGHAPAVKPGVKQQVPTTVTAPVVYLWPLLICKALLKLAAPDMNSDEESDGFDDELMPEFDIMHSLTGSMLLTTSIEDKEKLWQLITTEVQVFSWDDDDDTLASTVKSRSAKKPTAKESPTVKRGSMATVLIMDTKNHPPYTLPGITPGFEMELLISMARDLPLKKPLPEPEVALWKTYRWVDWARKHGLYEAYDCPRTRYLKVNGFLKLSYAPHLLDVQSTESITFGFREEHDKTNPPIKKIKEPTRSTTAANTGGSQLKEELREWMLFDTISELVKTINILYFPSMYEFTSASSNPPIRITKAPLNRAIDIPALKSAPLYLQIDNAEENLLRISLNVLHPRVLFNCGVPLVEYIEPAYLILEKFEWFIDCEIPMPKGYVRTRGYDTLEVSFEPGRHFCRLWVHSRMNWHMMLLSESALLLGTRDLIQAAATHECPWVSKFLTQLSTAFSNWIRVSRSNTNIVAIDREFYKSYQPDLEWDPEVVGYKRNLLHWMFRQALQMLLYKKLLAPEFRAVCIVLRRYFLDPDFGLPHKPYPPKSLRKIFQNEPCDCVMPEAEEPEQMAEQMEEQTEEEKPIVDPELMTQLLIPPEDPITSQICELATEELPCGILKSEREKVIRKHEAATCLQAHWRGAWVRKCLNSHVTFTPEVTKMVMETAFGTQDALSSLMNEFFGMYPGAKYAYSVASALSGVYGLQQHNGVSPVSPKCKWIPYFQGVFYCHAPVKVHFDVQSSLQYSTVAVYDNDTGKQMPQAYNAHITFDIHPNGHGYTVMGHGTLNQPLGVNSEVHWHLTLLSSIDDVFHVCDNDSDACKEQPLPASTKLRVDEIFIPNRRNILGGIQISVTKQEAVSFRASATSPELEIEAVLRTTSPEFEIEELGRCSGIGELFWPYISLEPMTIPLLSPTARESVISSARSLKVSKTAKLASAKNKSVTKLKPAPPDPKIYWIEVIAPNGWPLTLLQWKRVDEVRNLIEYKVEVPSKKPTKEKPGALKEKDKPAAPPPAHQPQLGDAYVELECSLAIGGGAIGKRDDERDMRFASARRNWDAKEPGRNLRGAQIRKDFRTEFLEALPPPPTESSHTLDEELFGEETVGEEEKKDPQLQTQQGPTPATESGMLEMTIESEEEAKYLTMPEQLKDKFIPLYFVPFCTREKTEDSAVLTADMAEAAKKDRHARIQAAIERMRELQEYNELFVLGRQKDRCQLLEKLFVDSQWSEQLSEVLDERDDAIAREQLTRSLSATKKKQEAKKK